MYYKHLLEKMKILMLLMAAALLAGCNPDNPSKGSEQSGEDKQLSRITVSKISQSDSGKPYLEVDGVPFAVYGAQIRIDIFRSVDKLSWDEIGPYFATAAQLGVNCVQLSYPWAFLEPKKDEYSFEEIDRILGLANRYDLKVELLWFSTNMIGDAYTYLVPNYILATPSVRLGRDGDGVWHGLYGYTYSLINNDAWILERETKAVTKLFNHIRVWDEENGGKHPVITCQIHNEPDAMVRWRMSLQNFKYKSGEAVTADQCWKMTLDALDAVGKAVKASKYSVATRTNIISGDGVKDFPQTPGKSPKDVYALEGIDFVSFDPYRETVNEIAYEVSQYASMKGNYPLIAENRGSYTNTPSLMLAASALGGGYDIYDLATSRYITSHSAPPFDSEGIYYDDLSPKNHVKHVKALLAALTAYGKDVALTPTEDFAVFNVTTDTPKETCTQAINTTGASLGFTTTAGAIGFVLDRGDRLVAWSSAAATLQVSGGATPEYAGGKLSMEGGKTYEITFKSAGKQTSTTKRFIGTIFK